MKKYFTLAGLYVLPVIVAAQGTTIDSVLVRTKSILDLVIPIIMTLALIYFFWGLAQYILTGSEEAKEEGRNRMIWGIIALFVMVSVWGLVGLIANTFLVGGGAIDLPKVPPR